MTEGGRRGIPVHAGALLRRGQIMLDAALLASPGEFARILTHELYHFVWWRLGNASRRSWEEVLAAELRAGVRGELGWSAELRKRRLHAGDWRLRSRRWREYVCESFCDTAGWLCRQGRRHAEFTLPDSSRRRRRAWFARLGSVKDLPL